MPDIELPLDFRIIEQKTLQVGDELQLKVGPIEGVLQNQFKIENLKIEVVGGSESLRKDGWTLAESTDQPEAEKGILYFSAYPLKSGTLTLPALSVMNGKDKVGVTQTLSLKVASALPEVELKGQIQKPEFLPQLGFKFPIQSALAWGAGALLVTALFVAALYYYLKKRWAKKVPTIETPIKTGPAKTPEQIALESLQKIESENLFGLGRFKEAYFIISDTLKDFVSCRYEIEARESTTAELFALLEENKHKGVLNQTKVSSLQEIFLKIDPVKFSDTIPTQAEAREILSLVKEWVRW